MIWNPRFPWLIPKYFKKLTFLFVSTIKQLTKSDSNEMKYTPHLSGKNNRKFCNILKALVWRLKTFWDTINFFARLASIQFAWKQKRLFFFSVFFSFPPLFYHSRCIKMQQAVNSVARRLDKNFTLRWSPPWTHENIMFEQSIYSDKFVVRLLRAFIVRHI